MPDDDLVYIGHMLDMARKAVSYAELGRERFNSDELLRFALTHLVQIMGEAARRVSPECRAAHADIPWTEIVGMRSKIVHDYFGVDEDVVWEVVRQDLPRLVEALAAIVPDDVG